MQSAIGQPLLEWGGGRPSGAGAEAIAERTAVVRSREGPMLRGRSPVRRVQESEAVNRGRAPCDQGHGAAVSWNGSDGEYLTRKAGGREAFCSPKGHGTSRWSASPVVSR